MPRAATNATSSSGGGGVPRAATTLVGSVLKWKQCRLVGAMMDMSAAMAMEVVWGTPGVAKWPEVGGGSEGEVAREDKLCWGGGVWPVCHRPTGQRRTREDVACFHCVSTGMQTWPKYGLEIGPSREQNGHPLVCVSTFGRGFHL